MSCIGNLDHPLKNRRCEKRMIMEQRGANVELAREGLIERNAVLERESAQDLVCQVLVRERASEKGGTEGVDSAVDGQSQLLSDLRHRRGNEAIEGSNPRSMREACWEAS